MKSIFLGLILISIFLLGCEDTSNITNPVLNSESGQLNKITEYDYELVPLPPRSQLWIDSVLTTSKTIDGDIGGRIILEKYYIAANGDSIIVYANLNVPPGAFTGTETITMTVDDEFCAIHFYPSMVFLDTLKLFQSFEGLDLSTYGNSIFDFVFIDEYGNFELIKKNGLQVKINQGIVRVQNAKLLHFSRYGWVRRPVPVAYNTPVFD